MKRVYVSIIAMLCIAVAVLFAIDGTNVGFVSMDQEKDLENTQQETLKSFKKISDGPLYTMTYYGDYGFKEYLKRGRTVPSDDSKSNDMACSCFAALNEEGDMIFGRNLDFYSTPKLILFTDSPDGYASVSMVDLQYLGFKSEKDINNATEEDLKKLLSAPYLTFDGMNEHGLAIGEMTAYGSEASIDPNKVTLGDITALRLVLDYAKTVEEAIGLLEKYNIYFPPAPPMHFLIADAKGNSAIIEYVKGEMKVIRNEEKWQVATNFIVYGSSEATRNSCRRYTRAQEVLRDKDGKLNEEEAMMLLKDISQPSTQWSVVYNMSKGNIQLAVNKKYDDIMKFKLPTSNN